jgi:DNA-binding PadR family transcriptional regulator
MGQLTDLEGATLAELARNGPMTSYAVARNFAASPSEFWSGSAGAIYPLFKRLEKRGFLTSTEGIDGKRAKTEYALTPEGKSALMGWLLDAKRAAGLGFDPLRTRAAYLELASPAERAAFMDAVAVNTKQAASQTVWQELPRMQAIHASVMKARVAWIAILNGIVR